MKQNNRHMVEVFLPSRLDREGDGWKLTVRIRLVHSQVRLFLSKSEDWDSEAWGVPISAAHLGFAATALSARLLKHIRDLGASVDAVERASLMAVWRYVGYLMGIPETILFRNEVDALELLEIGAICEPPPSAESIILANSLVQSAPLVVGTTDPVSRRKLAQYVFRVSQALIGTSLADGLKYPDQLTFGVLWWFRMQNRYDRIMSRLVSTRDQHNNRLAALFDVSVFDEGGINYGLPDHVYSEESSEW